MRCESAYQRVVKQSCGFLVPTAAIPDEEEHALETHPELLDDRKDIVACKMP